MKAFFMAALVLLATNTLQAQSNPVKWNVEAKKIDAKTYEIHFKATVAKPWHIYSQSTPDGGPIPTSIKFTKNPLVSMSGKTSENGEIKEKFEEVFDLKVKYFDGDAGFVQVIKLKNDKVKTSLSGNISYMACTDEQCLPPATYPFTVALSQ